MNAASGKAKIWDLVKGREEERELLRRALNVGLCPKCGKDVSKKEIGCGDESGQLVMYTCVCGFEHTRIEE